MAFFIVTALVYAVVIWLGTWLLEAIFRKLVPAYMATSGHAKTTVPIVAVTTGALMYLTIGSGFFGPYEQVTPQNVGGQLIAGVLVAGLKIWGTKEEGPESDDASTQGEEAF